MDFIHALFKFWPFGLVRGIIPEAYNLWGKGSINPQVDALVVACSSERLA